MRLLKVNEELSRISFWMLLACVGWKRGCQPFSCPWSENVTYCRKNMFDILIGGIFSLHSLGIQSIQSQREAWGSWEPQYAPPVLHCACIFPIPSLQLRKKAPVSCRDAKCLVTQLRSPRFCRISAASQWRAASLSAAHVLYVTHCRKEICWTCMSRNPCLLWNLSLHSLPEAWGPWERQHAPPASLWLHHPCKRWSCGIQTWKSMKNCRGSAFGCFSLRGLEAGLPAFQLPMVGKCDVLPKRYVRHTCWRHLFPPFLLNSKHPIPKRSLRFLRATVRSTRSALCLHHAHPFVVSAEKRTRFMQRSKAFGQAVVLSKICYDTVIAMWLLQTNEHLSRLRI